MRGRCAGEFPQKWCPRDLEDRSACVPVGCSLTAGSQWRKVKPGSFRGCLGVGVNCCMSLCLGVGGVCLCVGVCAHLGVSLVSLSAFSFRRSLFLSPSACVCVFVGTHVPCSLRSNFLHISLSSVQPLPCLCVGGVAGCQSFSWHFQFGFVRIWMRFWMSDGDLVRI